MALTFPSSPSNGQLYTDTVTGYRYIYNATAGVWSFSSNNVGMSVSSTPPSNVAPGSMWFNREIGRTFVYYDDGDSKQWIETVPAGAVDTNVVAGYVNPVFASMNGAYTTANGSYATANAAYGQANSFVGVYGVANAAYGKANTALQNTSGTFAGDLTVTGNGDFSLGTSYLKIPVGTTAQRPSSATNGMIRYNTTIPAAEIYNGSTTGWGTIRQDWLGVPETVTNLAYHRWGFPNVTGSFMINSGKSGAPLMLGGGYSLNSTTYKYGNAALDLNGSSGYGIFGLPIVATGQPVLGMISFWLYWRGHNGSGRSYLVDDRSGSYGPDGTAGYWILDSNNTMVVFCGGSEKTNSWTPTTNTWEHYALYTDGSSTYIYRNGSLSLTLSGAYKFSDRNILGTYTGAVGSSGNYFTNAIFDNILVSFHPSITPSVVYNEAFSY